jgi:hypothetical protein
MPGPLPASALSFRPVDWSADRGACEGAVKGAAGCQGALRRAEPHDTRSGVHDTNTQYGAVRLGYGNRQYRKCCHRLTGVPCHQ